MMFLLFLFAGVVAFFLRFSSSSEGFRLNQLDLQTLSFLSNDSLLDDKADNLRLIAVGIFLITVGGWLNCVLM